MTGWSNVVRAVVSEVLPTLFRPVRTVIPWVKTTHSVFNDLRDPAHPHARADLLSIRNIEIH